ncbi:aminodeoxychorismate synthase [Cladophialophora immunda]|uniref:aminodeoxychorismate synthase n=1 Tax=Cladophialophora immunda TaxID=569365 RepID=A0A0D2AQT5_9EURO|nr:aminodeoxychorismate synthase [Cladophialophora immunda]KIW27447.1 aminodeoxychorismate synthase [Cladophialophora immunda]
MTTQGSILFVDAYDSFAENIAALLREQLLVEVTLVSIDCDIPAHFNQSPEAFFAGFDAIVLGPGPGNPYNEHDVGLYGKVWACASEDNIPVLGICLGFQSLCAHNGVPVVRLELPCHGHAKEICHADRDIFCQSGSIIATNYNSLGVRMDDLKRIGTPSRPSSSASSESTSSLRSLPSVSVAFELANESSRYRTCNNLEVLAWDKDHWAMAVRHKLLPFHGFQFHPESCKSSFTCHKIIKQWWEATRRHNAAHRDFVSVIRLASPKLTEGTLLHESAALSRELNSLSKPCSGTVSRRSLHLPLGSRVIASLCYQRSPPNASVMLESTKRGQYSIYAFPDGCSFQLEYAGGRATLKQDSTPPTSFILAREHVEGCLASFLSSRSFQHDSTSDVPFKGGFMGFLSYEFGTASLHLDVPEQARSPTSTPEISLLWVERSIVFDNCTGMAYVQSIRPNDDCWVDEMVNELSNTPLFKPTAGLDRSETDRLRQILSSTNSSLPDHDAYISQIRTCQSELLAGNSYELCLTTEATVTTPAVPDASWLLYNNIQQYNPVPFAAFVRLHKITILSSSPEQFLSWSAKDGAIDMIPMKGTVKKSPEMTLSKAAAILSSAKESAENLMIADLIRHDLYSTVGRDAKVEVVKLCDVVESETVFSLVSHIRAHVPISTETDREADGHTKEMTRYGVRALTRTLPPGSMTGAPKKRSCEILHGLEQRDRGVYSGAIGYMDVSGNGAWSVCIRSAFSNDDEKERDQNTGEDLQKWRIGAGGAITVLSDEEQEWEEMMTKLDSVLRGFQME